MKLKYFILIIVGYLFYRYVYDGTDYMKSTIDQQYYKVQNSTACSKVSAKKENTNNKQYRGDRGIFSHFR